LSHKEAAVAGEDLDLLRHQISGWKNDLVTPAMAQSQATTEEEARAARLYADYDRCLRAYNAVDFDDLILMPTLLFRDNEEIREKWQHRIHYLLVDEYQDTNSSQYLLVRLLTGRRARFTVVGDDDQSIYAWRGARPENLVQLAEDYPALKVIKLEQNYRSTGCILKAANAVIDNNPHVFTKTLWSEHGFGDPIRILRCATEELETERVAAEIMHQKMQKNRDFRDFAVLYRGNHQSRLLEIKLQAWQIPYKVSGGTSFFSRHEIKDVMAYLRLMINPDDDNAFLRVVNTPRREIGPATLEKLGLYAQSRGVGLSAACEEMGLEQHITGRSLLSLQRFARWLDETRENIQRRDAVPAIRQMLVDIDYPQWLMERMPSPKAAERCMENVNQLVNSIERMLEKQDDEDIEAVIGKLVLIDMLEQREEEDQSDKVQLMTLHASKGLEFPYVFVMGLEEDILPHRNSIEADTIEEERRLMYVGITRAQRELTLTLSAKRKQFGEEYETTPSRFLDELPSQDIVWEGRPGENRSQDEKKALGKAYMANIRNLLD
jgi:ATP-dependent DNA helicase Rep